MKPPKDDAADLGDDLYVEELIDHYKNPRHSGKLEPADIHHDGDNPTCGDEVHVYARVDGENRIRDVRFQGKGCAISQASADILYGDLEGKRLDEVIPLNIDHVQGLLGITIRPARVKCATLALVALKEGIKEYQSRNAPKKALPGFGRRTPPA